MSELEAYGPREVPLRATKGGVEVARESLGKGEARQCSEVKKATRQCLQKHRYFEALTCCVFIIANEEGSSPRPTQLVPHSTKIFGSINEQFFSGEKCLNQERVK